MVICSGTLLIIVLGAIWCVFHPQGFIDNLFKKLSLANTLLAMLVGTLIYGEFKRKVDEEKRQKEMLSEKRDRINDSGNYHLVFLDLKSGPNKLLADTLLQKHENMIRVLFDNATADIINEDYITLAASFYATKEHVVLTDIIAFEEQYYSENRQKILSDYFSYYSIGTISNPGALVASIPNSDVSLKKENVFLLLVPKECINRSTLRINFLAFINGYMQLVKVSLKVLDNNGLSIVSQRPYYLNDEHEEIPLRM